jgi:1-acyl-sn-glycerol-3-phosphate acyltransferase
MDTADPRQPATAAAAAAATRAAAAPAARTASTTAAPAPTGATAAASGGRPSDPLRFAIAVVIGAVAFFGWSFICIAIRPLIDPRRRTAFGQRRIQRSFRWMLHLLDRLGMVTVDNQALDAIAAERPLIVVPNHPSMLDALVVIARLPATCCIMKQSLLHNFLISNGARLAGYVDNGSVTGMIRKSVAALDGGSQLLVFPEGTRSARRPVGDFTRSYVVIARKAASPMQTVLIETDSPYATKGWPLLRRPPLPIRYRVRLGRRFEPRDDIDAVVREMQAYFEAELGSSGRRIDR